MKKLFASLAAAALPLLALGQVRIDQYANQPTPGPADWFLLEKSDMSIYENITFSQMGAAILAGTLNTNGVAVAPIRFGDPGTQHTNTLFWDASANIFSFTQPLEATNSMLRGAQFTSANVTNATYMVVTNDTLGRFSLSFVPVGNPVNIFFGDYQSGSGNNGPIQGGSLSWNPVHTPGWPGEFQQSFAGSQAWGTAQPYLPGGAYPTVRWFQFGIGFDHRQWMAIHDDHHAASAGDAYGFGTPVNFVGSYYSTPLATVVSSSINLVLTNYDAVGGMKLGFWNVTKDDLSIPGPGYTNWNWGAWVNAANVVTGTNQESRFEVFGGISTTTTNATITTTPTGCTNNTAINQVIYVTAATGLSVTNNAGTAEFTGVTIAAFTPIRLQVGGKMVGTAITYAAGEHAQGW